MIPYLQIIQHLRKSSKCYVSKGNFLTNAEMFFLASFKDFEFFIASDEMFHSLVDGYLYIVMEEEKLTVRVELLNIVEFELGVATKPYDSNASKIKNKVVPSKWNSGLSKIGKCTSYIIKYGIDGNINLTF